MKKLLVICFSLLSMVVSAKVKVKVDPPIPVKEESFKVIFEVTIDTDEEPRISFYPIGLEVLGRNREVSVSSSYINGKFKSNKKIRYIYEMVSDEPRVAKLKNIEVTVGDKILKHPPVAINVQRTKRTPTAMFLRAEVDKEDAFVGEGIDLRYYLYTRVPVVQDEFKNFPKLNGFIKRFHKVNAEERTVEENGVIYKKILKYSGRIYPEKPGNLIIDPLKLNIQYATSNGSPFGNFGLSFNRFRSKTVVSKKVKIAVRPLPAENMPGNFTGLVGEHKLNLTVPKEKYVVNEAIEAKLEVVGPGALEKMEAPAFYNDDALEVFDTKSEFFEVGRSSGRKVFDYTFLARANFKLEESLKKLSYFDPEDEVYKEIEVRVPPITVGGEAINSNRPSEKKNNTDPNAIKRRNLRKNNPMGLDPIPVAPVFETSWKSLIYNWPKWLIYFLLFAIAFQLIEFAVKKFSKRPKDYDLEREIKYLRKNGITYGGLSNLIFRLPGSKERLNLRNTIDSTRLSEKDKKYFKELLDSLESKHFSEQAKAAKRIKFKTSSFNALRRELLDANS